MNTQLFFVKIQVYTDWNVLVVFCFISSIKNGNFDELKPGRATKYALGKFVLFFFYYCCLFFCFYENI